MNNTKATVVETSSAPVGDGTQTFARVSGDLTGYLWLTVPKWMPLPTPEDLAAVAVGLAKRGIREHEACGYRARLTLKH